MVSPNKSNLENSKMTKDVKAADSRLIEKAEVISRTILRAPRKKRFFLA